MLFTTDDQTSKEKEYGVNHGLRVGHRVGNEKRREQEHPPFLLLLT
jgi:hypothetical protein